MTDTNDKLADLATRHYLDAVHYRQIGDKDKAKYHQETYEALDSAKALRTPALEDPTPWCHVCGAGQEGDCACGPIAEND